MVPLPPGGTADLHARPLAAALEKILRQPVVVVNKPGGASRVGTQYVAASKPDGYTLLITSPSFSISPEVDRALGRRPVFTRDQFTAISRLSAEPPVLLVQASSALKSIRDLVAEAKRRPGGISYGSTGAYSTLHLATELFASAASIQLRHVPYEGGGPAMTALLGGHLDILPSATNVAIPQMKASVLRALAAWSETRLPALPEVPTFREQGYSVEFYLMVGMAVRKEVPPAVVRVLREGVRQAVNDPDFKSAMAKLGTPFAYLEAEEAQKAWDAQGQSVAAALERIKKEE